MELKLFHSLYGVIQSLMTRLASSSGILNKLSFSVSRVADVEKWASEAEDGLVRGGVGVQPRGRVRPAVAPGRGGR